MEPKIILLLSGKRKSGKDYIAEKLHNSLEDKAEILRISEPIKSHYARYLNLNLDELLSSNSYKETYRQEMIIWSDEVRKKDPGYFCNIACSKGNYTYIWIFSDIRRKTDIHWFHANYPDKIKTVRIFANQDVRIARGWVYTEGVDNVTSECDLDDWNDWDLQVNNNDEESLKNSIDKILNLLI
ncbi:phosphomevalonate kinase [Holotrichia oblita]|uniref:Phosphomevalonate kinase n=1 Tax=Holotrichia oblita TaxID=644536 RepID=A0ACB9SQQ0_HOLOL|nr:phosphomevalonate kinase [Holotrichia oblita]